MPEVSVDVDLYCACGEHLCHLATSGSKHGRPCFTIKPCPECMEAEKDKGDTEGYKRGLADGKLEAEGA